MHVWWPSQERIEAAAVTRLARRYGLASIDELVARARDPRWFWDAVVADLGLQFRVPYTAVLDDSRGPEWSTWFTDGMFALTDSCVRRWADSRPAAPAVISMDEAGKESVLSWAELDVLVGQIAGQLRVNGVGPGDVVAVFLPLTAMYVATLYACAEIGAVALPLFTGFGADAIAMRLNDARARAAVTTAATIRRGEPSPLAPVLAVAAEAAVLKSVLVIGRPDDPAEAASVSVGADDWRRLPGWRGWMPDADRTTASHRNGGAAPAALGTERSGDRARQALAFPSEHPFLLAYTSGTTGRPKGAVLTQAGLLLGVARDAAYHIDLKSEDVLCWPADPGWIMGPWQVLAAGAIGASLVLLEGLPGFPSADRLWRTLAKHQVTVFGCGPTMARSLLRSGSRPQPGSLASLRTLTSTGEPSDPQSWEFLFTTLGERRCPVMNISGGTEVGAAFLAPLPVRPLSPCSVGGPALGMDVGIVDGAGNPVGTDVTGELVCRAPWPSMTRGLLGAPERYLESYWRRWPGVWAHGDWASRDADGAWYVHGRSDETMNLAGKRTGPAEVEITLLGHPGVAEAAAFGLPDAMKGEALWCAVVPVNAGLDDLTFAAELRDLVASKLGAAFRPSRVLLVPGLPRTKSGKVMRGLLRKMASGDKVGDTSAMADPNVLGQLDGLFAAAGGNTVTGSNPSRKDLDQPGNS